ncbi:MAG: hypothetical protein WBQ34_02515 [Candidatus Acidiferrales bacterium]
MDFANPTRLQFYVSGAGTLEVPGSKSIQAFLFAPQAQSQMARDSGTLGTGWCSCGMRFGANDQLRRRARRETFAPNIEE